MKQPMKTTLARLTILAVFGGTALAAETTSVPPTSPTDGLLLEYRLDKDANDSSGRNLHGKLHGNPRFEVLDGRASMAFDGSGDWVEVDSKLPALGNEFTIECWVRPAAKQATYADIFGNHTVAGLGFVLQQDGDNTNSYAFNYSNGAGGWISTKPVKLAADRWQHVAIVKSADKLEFYLNGVLLDSTAATAPVAHSPMTLRVGLGFEDERRSFTGTISGFRVWDRALSEIQPEVTAEQKADAMASNTSVRLSTASPGRIFKLPDAPVIDVSFGDGAIGKSDVVIKADFECVDMVGKTTAVAPVELTLSGGFKQTLRLPLPAGFYRLTCKPTIHGPGFSRALQPETLSFAVLNDGAVEPLAAPATKAATLGSQSTLVTSLDGEGWLLATDPNNVGREEKWFSAPRPEAKSTKVPWIIQDVFPGYQGVAWYWKEFTAPANPHDQGRFILRFWAVDYLAEVWVNGVRIGQHEGSEDPFEFDVTDALKPNAKNQLAVRVLNPTKEGIDGIALFSTPRSCKNYPVTPGQSYNVGGIVDSVELLATPVVRAENIYAKPDWKTGVIDLEVNVRNAASKPVKGSVRFSVAPAQNGETLDAVLLTPELPPGDTLVRARLRVPQHRLWSLEDPFLYRVTAAVAVGGSASFDEKSTRCGFRDFRYENDAFRLNGKRLYMQGVITLPHYPVGFRLPPREDYLRRDLQAFKAMGLNNFRIIWGGLRARDLDVFDEMGILVQQEHYGAQHFGPDDGSPEMNRRFDDSISGVIRRDRNHPSIVIWCLLNEIWDGPQFRHAVQSLPMVKFLDDTRLVWLGSGGFDLQFSQGSLSNPGATDWQCLMGNETPGGPNFPFSWPDYAAMLDNKFDVKADIHPYQSIPHTVAEIQRMRTLGERANGRKIVISEIGTGCAINLPRLARHYEQMGAEYADDARYYRDKLDQFMADWKKWDLGRIWTSPEDFFTDSERNMVKLRRETGNALRANPHLAGYQFCALPDSDFNGDGLLNTFREIKPGVVELQNDLTAPVRWCLFAEPVNIYSGGMVKLEAVLSNLDALRPGSYPIRIEVVAPGGRRVFEEKIALDVPDPKTSGEPPLVREVFSREVPVSGATGDYKFVVQFERGAAATGGEITFRVFNEKEMPAVPGEVVLWGKDEGLAKWLADHNIRTRPYAAQAPAKRELILVGNGGGDLAAFKSLATRMAQGATVIFLSPSVFSKDQVLASGAGLLGGFAAVPLDRQQLAALPLANKGALTPSDSGGYYRGDTFAAKHPVFDGLPSGGVLDYTIFRNIITQSGVGLAGVEAPEELIVGGIRAQIGYASVVQMATFPFGAGRFVFNTLRIREELGKDPVAELLLRNLLNYAAPDLAKPPVAIPADFDRQLQAISYE